MIANLNVFPYKAQAFNCYRTSIHRFWLVLIIGVYNSLKVIIKYENDKERYLDRYSVSTRYVRIDMPNRNQKQSKTISSGKNVSKHESPPRSAVQPTYVSSSKKPTKSKENFRKKEQIVTNFIQEDASKSTQIPSSTDANLLTYQQKNLSTWQRAWRWVLSAIMSSIIGGLLGIILGYNTFNSSPLLKFVRQIPALTLPIIGISLLITLFMFSLWKLSHIKGMVSKITGYFPLQRLLMITTLISIFSISLCVVLSTLLLFQNGPVAHSMNNGPLVQEDANLELSFLEVQSSSWLINPSTFATSFPTSSKPNSTGIVPMDAQSANPYYLVISAHNKRLQGYSLLIEQVTLLIRQLPSITIPLNTWTTAAAQPYPGNNYCVKYNGQESTSAISAIYLNAPGSPEELPSGQTDTLDIQVTSTQEVDLKFQVQVTYRISDQATYHIVTLPFIFEVIFSSVTNWHPYQLQNGHLLEMPSPTLPQKQSSSTNCAVKNYFKV